MPVRRAYKSGQKVGGGSPGVRLGVGKRSEGFSDPRRDTQTNAGFPQETRQRVTEGERHRATEPKKNGYQDRKGRSAGRLRAIGRSAPRNAAEAPHRSFGARATGGRRAPRGSPHTLLRLGSRDAASGGVAGSRLWKRGEGHSRNLSPLRGQRRRAPSLLLAITQVRLPLGRKPLGIRRAPLGRLRYGRLRRPLALQLRFGLGGPGRRLGWMKGGGCRDFSPRRMAPAGASASRG